MFLRISFIVTIFQLFNSSFVVAEWTKVNLRSDRVLKYSFLKNDEKYSTSSHISDFEVSMTHNRKRMKFKIATSSKDEDFELHLGDIEDASLRISGKTLHLSVPAQEIDSIQGILNLVDKRSPGIGIYQNEIYGLISRVSSSQPIKNIESPFYRDLNSSFRDFFRRALTSFDTVEPCMVIVDGISELIGNKSLAQAQPGKKSAKKIINTFKFFNFKKVQNCNQLTQVHEKLVELASQEMMKKSMEPWGPFRTQMVSLLAQYLQPILAQIYYHLQTSKEVLSATLPKETFLNESQYMTFYRAMTLDYSEEVYGKIEKGQNEFETHWLEKRQIAFDDVLEQVGQENPSLFKDEMQKLIHAHHLHSPNGAPPTPELNRMNRLLKSHEDLQFQVMHLTIEKLQHDKLSEEESKKNHVREMRLKRFGKRGNLSSP